MRKCIVPGCGRSQANKENIPRVTFHRVPKNEERRAVWLTAIGRKQWLISLLKQAVVCSLHFIEECFDRTSSCGLVPLRDNALPIRFLAPVNYNESGICSHPVNPEVHDPTSMLSYTDVEMENVSEQPLVQEAPIAMSSTSTSLLSSISTQTSETFYNDLASRQKLTLELAKMTSRYKSVCRESRNLKRRDQRKKKKLANMKNIIFHLSKNKLLGRDNLKLLSQFSITSKELCLRQLKRTDKYSPELRKFAIALHFYSPKAYRFVRSEFDTCLPHPKVIASWYRSINGQPGFTKEAFTAIELRKTFTKYQMVGNIVFDEIAIRPRIEWYAGKFYGYENFGPEFENVSHEVAKQALVFLMTELLVD